MSLEEPRRLGIVNTGFVGALAGAVSINTAGVTARRHQRQPVRVGGGAALFADQSSIRYPDIVMNWRVDQAWGAAMIGGAIHDASGGYYGNTVTGATVNGHPTDKIGWVATAGLRLNAPTGSYFQAQASYAEGALRYLSHTQFANRRRQVRHRQLAGLRLCARRRLWHRHRGRADQRLGGVRGLRPHLGPRQVADLDLRRLHHGRLQRGRHRADLERDLRCARSNAVGAFPGAGAAGSNLAPAGTVTSLSNCSPDWAIAYIGSRTQYNFTPDFYAGIDVIYTKLSTAFSGTGVYRALAGTARPTGIYTIEDQDTSPSRSASIATSGPDRLKQSLNPNPRRRPRRGFCLCAEHDR